MLIDEPPAANACTGCWKPLVWVYSARTAKWVAVVPDPADASIMRVHRCEGGIPQNESWREVDVHRHDPDAAERAARGRALVDAALSDHKPAAICPPDVGSSVRVEAGEKL